MAEPSLEFVGEHVQRLQVEVRQLRAEMIVLRNRVDANAVRIEEVVLLVNEFRLYVGREVMARLAAIERSIDARFAQVHDTMATNMTILLAAIEGLKRKE
jgi:hypothetical protein